MTYPDQTDQDIAEDIDLFAPGGEIDETEIKRGGFAPVPDVVHQQSGTAPFGDRIAERGKKQVGIIQGLPFSRNRPSA